MVSNHIFPFESPGDTSFRTMSENEGDAFFSSTFDPWEENTHNQLKFHKLGLEGNIICI